MQTANDPVPVMVLGCGRSGTSIFGELFEHLPPYTYLSEPPFRDVMTSSFLGLPAFKVPRESEGFTPLPGLSFPLDQLLQEFPDIAIFWIVRHPLDAICSLRIGIANNWGHHPKPPDWQKWLSRPLLEQCAHHWQHINSVGYDQVASRATTVHFEDMIRNPQVFAQQVCARIGVNPRSCEAELMQWARRVQNTNNEDFVEAKTSRHYSRPDHSVRVERWRENLTPDDVQTLLPILTVTAKRFNYSLPGSSSSKPSLT